MDVTSKIENEIEIENILNKQSTINQPEIDKPLSPVLSSGRPKLFRRHSLVKCKRELSKNFREKSVDMQIREFNEEHFTLKESEDLLECIDKLEQIEKNRKDCCKLLTNNKISDFSFKKPASPAPKKMKYLVPSKNYDEPIKELNNINESIDIFEKRVLTQDLPVVLPKQSNFQTATGKDISISQDNLQKHSQLFNDILNCSQKECRKNKYNVLKKSSQNKQLCEEKTDVSLTQQISDCGISKTQLLCPFGDVLSNEFENFIGFTTDEVRESILLQSNHQSKRKLKQFEIYPNNKKIKVNTEIKPKLFKFSHQDGKIQSSKQLNNNSNNDKLKLFDLLIESSESESTSFEKLKPISISSTSSFGGFSSASGKVLSVTHNSLEKSHKIFENIDIDLCTSKGLNNQQNLDSINGDFRNDKLHIASSSTSTFSRFSNSPENIVPISSDSLTKAQNRFNSITMDLREKNKENLVCEDKPHSKSTKRIKVDSHLLNKELQFDTMCGSSGSNFGGFTNASGKVIPISSNSLIKAHNMFNDLTEDLAEGNSKGERANDADKLRTQCKKEFKPDSELSSNEPKVKPVSVKAVSNLSGFSNASGKVIHISSNSLLKAHNIFNDIMEDLSEEGDKKCDKLRTQSKEEFKGDSELSLNNKLTVKPISIDSISNLSGFSNASGKVIPISSNSLIKAQNMFNDLTEDLADGDSKGERANDADKLRTQCKKEFKPDSELSSNEPKVKPVSVKAVSNVSGFSNASGKVIHISSNSLLKAHNIFNGIMEDLSEEGDKKCDKLRTQSKEEFKGDSELSLNNKLTVKPISIDSISNLSGFSNALGKVIPISSNSLIKAQNMFNSIAGDCDPSNAVDKLHTQFKEEFKRDSDLSLNNKTKAEPVSVSSTSKFSKFSNDSKKVISTASNSLSKTQDISKDLDIVNSNNTKKQNRCLKDKLKYFDELIGDDLAPDIPQPSENSFKLQKSVQNKLKYFDELLGNDENLHNNNIPTNFGKSYGVPKLYDVNLERNSTGFTTPQKNLNNRTNSSSFKKRKLGVSSCKQILIPESNIQKAKLLFEEDLAGISPLKPSFSCSTPVKPFEATKSIVDTPTRVETKVEDYKLNENYIITLEQPLFKNITDFGLQLEEEYKKLEEKLKVIQQRLTAVENLKQEKPDCYKRAKPGVLSISKMRKDRISLRHFVNGKNDSQNHATHLFSVTPQNAGEVHFKESSATIVTKDGAVVVPNNKNLVGIQEIEFAFIGMPGVDSKLIPKGWIENHYKWIIWKLISYERMFPLLLTGSLSVEHVIQQLKYRYDREIDKVQRPALRKILEKDDVPQKRIVLCISNIKNNNLNCFELELTDGWYCIRTVIDEPLNQKMLNGSIKVGTKLVTCGAELHGCDGCHPLEVTDQTYLKINFNSTRKAKWDTRLGYQNCPGPILIPIHTVHHNGGPIGAVDICIARIYPLRYLEKTGGKNVWRNKKAEERREQEWENERFRKIEKIQEDLAKEINLNGNRDNQNLGKNSNIIISDISCPKRLLELMENSNDPDSIQEQLSPSQVNSILIYKQKLYDQKLQEMSNKVKNSAEKLKINKRDVTPVMKVLVVDLNGSPTRAYNLIIWKPSECHLEVLKEESCLRVFNVMPKANGDLVSTSKTVFRSKPVTTHMSAIFKRKLIPIADLDDMKFSKNFSEFDTIGIVVFTVIETEIQEIWLCDISGRLLFIKIFESPNTCLLLDNLRRGQTISACNLIYRGLSDDISKAAANHFTVFSSYSKYKHLQDGLEKLSSDLPKDLTKLLDGCASKIFKYRNKDSSRNSLSVSCLDDDDSTLIPERMTNTDIVLSLMDMDKFI